MLLHGIHNYTKTGRLVSYLDPSACGGHLVWEEGAESGYKTTGRQNSD